MALTKKQKSFYEFICDYIKKNGISPTRKELMEHFNFKSAGSVQDYLGYLEELGLVKIEKLRQRGIIVLGDKNCCPVCGNLREVS
jgi:repressor LexA